MDSPASTVDRRSTRWAAHRRARREELLDAAVRAIRQHGATVGMEEIAAAAGTSKSALYRHFADKRALHVALSARVADRLWDELREVGTRVEEPRELLAQSIDVYLALIEADRELYRFVVHHPLVETSGQGAGEDPDPLATLSALIGDSIARMLGARLRLAGRPTAPAGPWGHGLVGLVRAAGDHWLAQPDRVARPELTAHLVALGWDGFAGVLPPSSPPAHASATAPPASTRDAPAAPASAAGAPAVPDPDHARSQEDR